MVAALTMATMSFTPQPDTTPTDPKAAATVKQIDGKYVFINSTPSSGYSTAFEFETVVHGMGCPSIDEMATAAVKTANKRGFPYDAIILGNTKSDLAITFSK